MIRTLLAVLAVAAVALVPATALAAKSTDWSGRTANPGGHAVPGIGAQTLQLQIRSNRIVASGTKLVMLCTNSATATTRSAAFTLNATERGSLVRNRFALNFVARSGGWHVLVNLAGRLGANGRGSAHVDVTASGVTEGFNTTAERCSASADWRMKRSPTA